VLLFSGHAPRLERTDRLRSSRPGAAIRLRTLDQTFAQTTLTAQPPFDPIHGSAVAFVIVSHEVQKTMQREDPQLGRFAVPRFVRLAFRDIPCDDDVSENTRGETPARIRARQDCLARRSGVTSLRHIGATVRASPGKRQDVGGGVLLAVRPIQRADSPGADKGDADGAPSGGRGDAAEPCRERAGAQAAPTLVGHEHAQCPPTAVIGRGHCRSRTIRRL
jgi:hypothetical protein